ncbi:MAG: ethanolamine utilization protein EutN [Ruminiclostridium sp.]|nr:ethanolamine utilization protein EutN [Ruminiclostridium sp.]
MFYGKVIGSVVATVKDIKLKGCKLLIVQKTNYDGENDGSPIIAVDSVQAGIGDFVYMAKGKEASLPFGDMEHPVDAAIIGIIDRVNVKTNKE